MANKVKLTQEELNDIVFEDGGEFFEIIEKSEWEDNGKWQHQDIIFKWKADGKIYSLAHGRSGSYYTDWYWEVQEGDHDGMVTEVRQVEKVVKTWEAV